jgi:hypothetical protein
VKGINVYSIFISPAVSIVGKMHRSTSDVNLNQYNGVRGMVNNQDALKDDKKKRGRSPFRLAYVLSHKKVLLHILTDFHFTS